MASPGSLYCTLKAQFHQATAAAKDGKMPTDNTILDEPEENPVVLHAIATIDQYLMDNSPVYRDLQQLRAKVSHFGASAVMLAYCRTLVAFLTMIHSRDGKTQREIASSRSNNVEPTRTVRRPSSASTT